MTPPEQAEVQALRARRHADEGVHLAGGAARPGDVRGAGRGQRIPGTAAGQTIAATYPAAVIGMAVLRVFKGSILEENIARTAGSIGESVAAGAIFTLPAFVMAKAWAIVRFARGLLEIDRADAGGQRAGRAVRLADPPRDGGRSRTALPRIGGGGGDPQGRTGAAPRRRSICSTTSASARSCSWRGAFDCYAPDQDFFFHVGQLGTSTLRLGPLGSTQVAGRGRRHHGARRPGQPGVSSASATSSDRNWRRSISPAACWPGDC